ncbi:MAG: hypothetical protein FJX23_05910 [Alphaproteobacteria bacterium]|nr:hypothetical protein [Alphaproteobacteria bacterium]
MRTFITLALAATSAITLSACAGGQPGSQHLAAAEPDRVVVERTYETQVRPVSYVAPATVATQRTYIDDDGHVIRQQAVVPQAVVVTKPAVTTAVVEERRYYNDDYTGREQSQAERQALSREHFNSCPPGAAKAREC